MAGSHTLAETERQVVEKLGSQPIDFDAERNGGYGEGHLESVKIGSTYTARLDLRCATITAKRFRYQFHSHWRCALRLQVPHLHGEEIQGQDSNIRHPRATDQGPSTRNQRIFEQTTWQALFDGHDDRHEEQPALEEQTEDPQHW